VLSFCDLVGVLEFLLTRGQHLNKIAGDGDATVSAQVDAHHESASDKAGGISKRQPSRCRQREGEVRTSFEMLFTRDR